MNKILIVSICLTLCGCAQSGRYLLTGAGAAGGAALGHGLSGGSLPATVGGAAAGALVGEAAWSLKTKAQIESFRRGYTQGRADAAKASSRALDAQVPRESVPRYRRVPITIPARREGGVLYEPQTRTIIIAE